MKPTPRLLSTRSRAEAGDAENKRDVSGLAEQRQQALRALEQTREARQSGEIEKGAARLVEQLENGLTSEPRPGPPTVVAARVVASGDSKSGQPAVPLAGLIARLKVNNEIVAERETSRFGLVNLERPKQEEGSYELEVLGPNCNVIACQKGRWGPNQSPAGHRIELARSEELKPQLERAAKLEEAIKKARERAEIARDVVIKALDAQEQKLIEYLSEIDEELKGEQPREDDLRKELDRPLKRQQAETPQPVTPVETQATRTTELNIDRRETEARPKLEEKPKPEEQTKPQEQTRLEEKRKPQERPKKEVEPEAEAGPKAEAKTGEKEKAETRPEAEASLKEKKSETKQRRTDKDKKTT